MSAHLAMRKALVLALPLLKLDADGYAADGVDVEAAAASTALDACDLALKLADAPLHDITLHHALRDVRRTLERAEAGELDAQREILRMAFSGGFSQTLARLSLAADPFQATQEAIRAGAAPREAAELRFANEHAHRTLIKSERGAA